MIIDMIESCKVPSMCYVGEREIGGERLIGSLSEQ